MPEERQWAAAQALRLKAAQRTAEASDSVQEPFGIGCKDRIRWRLQQRALVCWREAAHMEKLIDTY